MRLLQALACVMAALLMWLKSGRPLAAMAIGVVGSLVLAIGLTAPRLLAPVDRVVIWIAKGVGLMMSWLTLVPFFWLCMVPGRLILLALGKDLMRRTWDPTATTYWTAKEKKSGGPHAQF